MGDLYLAAFDPRAAARVAPSLNILLGGGAAAVWTLDPRTGAPAGRALTNMTVEALAGYAAHWHAHDPWTVPLLRSTPGRVVRGAELIADDALLRNPYYAEHGILHGQFHVLGTALPLWGADDAPRLAGAVSIQRPRGAGAFEDFAVQGLNRLLPHLRRSLQLEAQDTGGTAGGEMLEVLSGPAAVLDGSAMVLRANAAAEALDREGGPLRLRGGGGAPISATGAEDTAWLRRAVADAARGGAGGARRLADAGGAQHAVLVTPLPRQMLGQDGRGRSPGLALLLLRRLSPGSDEARLTQLGIIVFGFTSAEAQAAAMLASGRGPEEVATIRAVRLSTVRTLLRNACDKAGVQNLRELVRILTLLLR
ncbi:hypothetical protein [Roseomonas indoligenes]|uniref:HTH luxR-type domain-containing protein n=1 Tax=Roseomonas indoligenes TaxID=2820811 RepID=A0A940MUB8_9PROT|nr:hypothetical protein [Pararoseomonas indoligenes]MBP0493579.1 hypothetical protein [Pararoseomonas indoligenes]